VRLRIDGRDYEAVNHRTATVADLLALRQQTAGPPWEAIGVPPGGLGMRALERMARASARAHHRARRCQDEGGDPADPSADPQTPDDGDLWLGVVVFLTRRAAGEKVSLLEAMDIAPADIEVLDAPEETDDESDPPEPGDAGPATSGNAPAPCPARSSGPSTTSPDPSANGWASCPITGPASPR
jgi:hypothetical protein